MSDLKELAAAVDERLMEFGRGGQNVGFEAVGETPTLLEAIDLREENGGGFCGIPEGGKPWFPKLHISNSQDKSLMKLPREGTGVVRYCVKRREIDESREDGMPRYGATVEIQSIEPMEAQELAARIEERLVEFGGKVGKRVPFTIKDGLGAYGQDKLSSGSHMISGRVLRKAGVPKEQMRAAVKMRQVFANRGQNTRGIASTKWPGKEVEIGGKLIRGGNGIDILYADSRKLVEFARGDQAAKFIANSPLKHQLRPGSVHAGTAIESVLKKQFKPKTWGAQTVPVLRQRVSDSIKHERFVKRLPKGEGRGIADAIRSIHSSPIMGTRKPPVKGAYVPAKEFSSDRDRDDAGRFAPGSAAPKADDYATAHGRGAGQTIHIHTGKEKRKGRLRAGMALGAGGVLAYQNRGRIAGMLRG